MAQQPASPFQRMFEDLRSRGVPEPEAYVETYRIQNAQEILITLKNIERILTAMLARKP